MILSTCTYKTKHTLTEIILIQILYILFCEVLNAIIYGKKT